MDNKLKSLYEKLNKHVLHIRLSKKVDETPINMHYMRDLKKCIKDIKLFTLNKNQKLNENSLIDKATKLLIIKVQESVENTEHHVSHADLEGTAHEVVVDKDSIVEKSHHESEKQHDTKHEMKQPNIKTAKGAQKGGVKDKHEAKNVKAHTTKTTSTSNKRGDK